MDYFTPPCIRDKNLLILCDFPSDTTVDDIASEFQKFGEVLGIQWNPINGTFEIEFGAPRDAAMAQKYVMAPYLSSQMVPQMMSSMVGGAMMPGPMMMSQSLMNPMMHPMMPRVNGSMVGNMGSVLQKRTSARFTPRQDSPRSEQNIKSSDTIKFSESRQADGSPLVPVTQNSFQNGQALDSGDAGEDGVVVEVGPCTKCLTRTSYTCGRCGVFYCSRDCQKSNWPDHQNKCNSGLPPLNYAGKKHITEIEIIQYDKENGRVSPAFSVRGHSDNQQAKTRSPRSPNFIPGSERNTNLRHTPESKREELRRRPTDSPNSSLPMNGRDSRTGRNERQNDADRQGINSGSSSNYDKSIKSPPEDKKPNHVATEPKSPCFPALQRKNTSEKAPEVASDPPKSSVMSRLANLTLAASANSSQVQASSPPTSPPDARTEIPPCLVINNGDPVAISHFENNTVYLRSNAPKALDQMVKMTRELAEHCAKAEPLGRNPRKHEFLAAKYRLDDTYYRAVVVSKPNKNEAKFEVCFVDFGNIDGGVPISHMVPLSESLAKVPILCSKTSFSNVPDSKFTSQAKDLVNGYFVGELPLVVEFSGKYEDGVTLKDQKTGDCLNDKILECLNVVSAPVPPTVAPVAAPAPVVVHAPTPAVVPAPVAAPAPAVVPAPVAAPVPAVVPEPTPAVVPAPVAAPVPVVVPTPAPVPVVVPTPAPVPVVVPTPAPVPVVAPAPAPVPVVVPAPVAAPVPVVVPAPTPAPVPAPVAAPVPAVVPAPVPTPATPVPKKFLLDDIKSVEFPPKGTATDVYIFSVVEEGGFLMACPVDVEAIQAAAVLAEQFEAYAATVQPFHPQENELCLAKWTDDCWYRAVCLYGEGSDNFRLMFLEYGNMDTIPLANIRPFKEDYLKVKALSSMCLLSGPELNGEQVKKLQKMYRDEWVVQATVIDIADGPIVTLDIPEIRNAL